MLTSLQQQIFSKSDQILEILVHLILFKDVSCQFYVFFLSLLFWHSIWMLPHFVTLLIRRRPSFWSFLFNFLSCKILPCSITVALFWHIFGILIEFSLILTHYFFTLKLLLENITLSRALGSFFSLHGSKGCHWRTHIWRCAGFRGHLRLYLITFCRLFVQTPKLIFLLLRNFLGPSLFTRLLHRLDSSLKFRSIEHSDFLEQFNHENYFSPADNIFF